MQITLTIEEGGIGPYGQFELLSGGQDFELTLPPRMCLEIATELGRILVGIHDSPGAKRIRQGLRVGMEAEIQMLADSVAKEIKTVEDQQNMHRQLLRLLPDEEKATS